VAVNKIKIVEWPLFCPLVSLRIAQKTPAAWMLKR
jgi:hypothetical protein